MIVINKEKDHRYCDNIIESLGLMDISGIRRVIFNADDFTLMFDNAIAVYVKYPFGKRYECIVMRSVPKYNKAVYTKTASEFIRTFEDLSENDFITMLSLLNVVKLC